MDSKKKTGCVILKNKSLTAPISLTMSLPPLGLCFATTPNSTVFLNTSFAPLPNKWDASESSKPARRWDPDINRPAKLRSDINGVNKTSRQGWGICVKRKPPRRGHIRDRGSGCLTPLPGWVEKWVDGVVWEPNYLYPTWRSNFLVTELFFQKKKELKWWGRGKSRGPRGLPRGWGGGVMVSKRKQNKNLLTIPKR